MSRFPIGDSAGVSRGDVSDASGHATLVRENQARRSSDLLPEYDYIVCGSGSSGSVVARRLAENQNATVLLVEAGGSDDVPAVTNPTAWLANLGSERDWGFVAEPNPHLNGRAMPLSMGKVLGGGSSINVSCWSRGHKNDWDHFAAEAGDAAWGYEAVLDIYRRIEDWQGAPDALRRGVGGLVHVEAPQNPNPIAEPFLNGAASVGIPRYEDQNGVMMEGVGGAAFSNIRVRNGKRQSVFRSYAHPVMAQRNLTVLTHAVVTRVLFEGSQCLGIELHYGDRIMRIAAGRETILSLGAINTPKLLMQSGIGHPEALKRFDIPVIEALPGIGQNFQDHVLVAGCVWEYETPLAPSNNGGEATLFWKSDAALATPDLQPVQAQFPISAHRPTPQFDVPANGWTILPGIVRPKSRGEITLTGASPADRVRINANTFSHPDDLKALVTGVELCRSIGNSDALRPFSKREAMPGDLCHADLEHYVRNTASTYWHQSCTAKMGRDAMSVVDAQLKVYGIEGLRIADASIMPRVTTGNTMAPCVIIGERMGEILARA
jgi:choline dehydrogenase